MLPWTFVILIIVLCHMLAMLSRTYYVSAVGRIPVVFCSVSVLCVSCSPSETRWDRVSDERPSVLLRAL